MALHPAPRLPADPRRGREARRRLRDIAREHPRWGWKTAHAILRRDGWSINRKRTQRLWRSEGLRRPAPCKRKRRRPESGELFRAERPNHVWALDFQCDETADQRRLKLLNIVDEHTRGALAMRVGRTCDADQVVEVIEALVAQRGAPGHLRMDNGPELIAWALRELERENARLKKLLAEAELDKAMLKELAEAAPIDCQVAWAV